MFRIEIVDLHGKEPKLVGYTNLDSVKDAVKLYPEFVGCYPEPTYRVVLISNP